MVWGNWANAQWYVTDKVQNGDFALDPLANGWVASGSYTYPSNGNPDPGVTLYQPDGRLNYNIVGLTPGVEYKVAADTDFAGDVARSGDVKVWVNVYDSAGVLLNGVCRDGGNGWIRLENVFTAPADGKVRIELTGQTYPWETQAYWDNVVLYSSVDPWYVTDKIKNNDFTLDPLANGWVASGSYTYPSNGNPDPGVTLYQPDGRLNYNIIGLTSGVEYKVAADTDFAGDVARSGDVKVWVNVYDSTGTLLNGACRDGGNGWIRLENVFTAPADGKVRIELTGQTYPWETQAYWDNVVLYSSVPYTPEEPVWYRTPRIINGSFSVEPITNGWFHESGNMVWPKITDNTGYAVMLSKIWDDDPDALLSQTITEITAGLAYKVAADTDFFGDVPRNGDVHVWLNVYDSVGILIGQAQRNGGNGWITLEVEFTAPADGIVRVQITGQNYYWEAEAYWDNVILYSSVEEEEPIDPNAGKIQNGDFTVGITGWNYWGTDGVSTYVFGAFGESTTQWSAPANIGLSGSVYWDENFGNPEPCATVYHNAVWGVLGLYQVVPVVPGTEYTLDAQWKSATGMPSSCYAEFIVYDATAVEVDDIQMVLVNSCSNWPQNSIVAKKDTFSNLNGGNMPWNWQSITASMSGGFDHAKGANKVTPANPYLVLVFKFGGTYSSPVSFQIDNVTLSTQVDRIPGDANGDNMVDVGDLGILAANYGGSNKTWERGDFNGDKLVDVGDLGILAANYGRNANSSTNWATDYAQVFGTTVDDDNADDEDIVGSVCSALGLPLIAGLALMGLMLMKQEE
jgi:hypothetical protein